MGGRPKRFLFLLDGTQNREREEYAENEKTIRGLVDSLGMVGESAARGRVLKKIEELSQENQKIESNIHEAERLAVSSTLSAAAFADMCQARCDFRTNVDEMHIEQKRAAVRALINKVIWDGVTAHVVLSGADA